MPTTTCKRWHVGDIGFCYDPLTELPVEAEVIEARYEYQIPVIFVRELCGDSVHILHPKDLIEESS